MKYPGQESAQLEFKSALPAYQQITKTVIGFCNLFGGKIAVGVADDGEIVGIDEQKINTLIDAIQHSIFTNCSPIIIPNIYTQRIHNFLLLIIEVSPGMNKPYFLTHEGMEKGTYVRIGALTTRATPEIIRELQWKSKGYSLDEMPLYTTNIQSIDAHAFDNFLNQRKTRQTSIAKDNLSFMKSYKIVLEEQQRLYATTAGILLFCQNPQQYLSEAFVICTHFHGTEGRHVLATRDCTGTLFQQVNDCLAFLSERLYHQFEIKAAQREEMLEIPEEALREIVINALIHRNYQIPGPCKIAIYTDRVEIFSPGNFPGPLQSDKLEMGITYIRNPVICRIFREAGYIEKLGSGFITLFSSYRKRKLPTPSVIESHGFVKCILPRPSNKIMQQPITQMNDEQNDREIEILNMLDIAESIVASDVIQQLKVSRQTAYRVLSLLVKKGRIKKKNKGSGTVYFK